MTRIDIIYDGHPYSLTADVSDVKERILTVAGGGEPFWLTVNEGDGTVKPVDLLITAGTRISIAGISSE